MFNSASLTLARKRRGMSKLALAKKVGVTVRMIVAYESERYSPSDETLLRIAETLHFPAGFFQIDDIEEIACDGASFRALKSMTAWQREAALAAGSLAIRLCRWIERRFNLPEASIPSMRGFEPEAAAQALRMEWGLGELPVRNMVHLLEAKGVRVFSLPVESARVDAFSVWQDKQPFVFLNNLKSGERSRFDCAHELAHLTLHQHGSPHGRQAEFEADRFASAFLMPQATVLASAPREPNLQALVRLKRNWKVSVAALVQRLKALNILTEWRYRALCIEISEHGYRSNEPQAIERENSQILSKVFTLLREDGMSRQDIARDLSLPVAELESLMRGLVLFVIPGGRNSMQRKVTSSFGKPPLRLVTTE
jgi:Zn-dependent peptidase ImmA (M78 family)/DNA-binding XRE family transcriptional regulator